MTCEKCQGSCACHINPPCSFCTSHSPCVICDTIVCNPGDENTVQDKSDGSEVIVCDACLKEGAEL